MILRELLASFGIQYDSAGEKKAEKAISGLKSGLETLGQAASAAGIGLFIQGTINAASQVQEVINRTNGLFGEGAEKVKAWAENTAYAFGSSDDTLLGLAAQVGGLTNTFAENEQASADMAMRLSEVASDLGAFYSEDPSTMVAALTSGLLGMDRPLKKYGLLLNDAALEEFRLSEGISKSVKSMTEQEKGLLRYKKIVASTDKFTGSSVKALERYAGATKAFKERWGDLKEALGDVLLPSSTKFLNWARTVLESFLSLVKGTKLLESVMVGLSVASAALALKAFGPWLLSILPLIIAFGAFVLVMDEVWTTLTGGKTIINALTKDFTDWYDRVMEMDLRDSPILSFLRDILEGAKKAKDMMFALFMAARGDFSGLEMLKQEHLEEMRGKGILKDRQPKTWDDLMTAQDKGLDYSLMGKPNMSRAPVSAVSNKTFNMQITQKAGEDSASFAKRVSQEISRADSDDDLAMSFLRAPAQ